MSSGWSALVLCLILGKRNGFGKRAFAAAQPGADHGRHRHAVGRLVRLQRRQRGRRRRRRRQRLHDHHARRRRRRLRLAGCSSGSRAASPPCSASARAPSPAWSSSRPAPASSPPASAVIIGVLAGVVPFLACTKLKAIFKYDDALDTFGVHGVGGTLGALLTGVFATPDVNANLNTNLADARRQRARGSSSSRPSASRWCSSIVGTAVHRLRSSRPRSACARASRTKRPASTTPTTARPATTTTRRRSRRFAGRRAASRSKRFAKRSRRARSVRSARDEGWPAPRTCEASCGHR